MQSIDSFVDAVGGVSFNGQVVKIDCLSVFPQPSDPSQVSSRLAGRLVLTPNTAAQLRDVLIKLFDDMAEKSIPKESKKAE